MSSKYALENLKNNWSKIVSRKEEIEIPIFGTPEKPYKAFIRVLSPKDDEEITEYSLERNDDGTVKPNNTKFHVAVIIKSLIDPANDQIFSWDDANSLLEMGTNWNQLSQEIQKKQKKMEDISAKK